MKKRAAASVMNGLTSSVAACLLYLVGWLRADFARTDVQRYSYSYSLHGRLSVPFYDWFVLFDVEGVGVFFHGV